MERLNKDVSACARCGGDHEAVEFRELGRPTLTTPPITHWAPCPATGEPILMASAIVVDAPGEPEDAGGSAAAP